MDKARIKIMQGYAQELLDNNKPVFIKDINNNFYFADILLVGEETIYFQCFSPVQRKDEKISLSWNKIIVLDEYKEIK